MTTRAFDHQRPAFPRQSLSLTRLLLQSLVQFAILLIVLAPPMSLGARVESFAFPIRTNQSIPADSIVRTQDRLCWTWVSDKVRLATSDNIDVFLDTADGDRSYPEVFDSVTNVPWHRNGALPVGHYEHGYCIRIPAYIKPGDAIRLRQTIHYRGLWNLWTILVPLPVVASP